MAAPKLFPDWVYAYNEEGDYRKIHRHKYPRAIEIFNKMKELVGKPVVLRTSMNVGNYSFDPSTVYFSDVYLVTACQKGGQKMVTQK